MFPYGAGKKAVRACPRNTRFTLEHLGDLLSSGAATAADGTGVFCCPHCLSKVKSHAQSTMIN